MTNSKEYAQQWYLENADRIKAKQMARRRAIGIPPRKFFSWSLEEELNIMDRLLNSNATTRSLAQEYNCCPSIIKKVLRKHSTKEGRLEAKHRKQASTLTGHRHSEKFKQKISRATSGSKNPFYGRKHSEEFKRKQAARKRGKPTSKRHKIAVSAAQQGISVTEWQGFKTPENERIRGSQKYTTWRTSIFKRDKYVCQLCKERGGKLHAHHIRSFAEYPKLRFDLANGITLCEDCHREVEKNPEVWVLTFEVAR